MRDRRLLGLKFRRQHQIGDYIVDFYCDEKKLVIELDGLVHDSSSRKRIDHKRDAYLQSLGLKIIRVANERLLNNTATVLNEIAANVLPSPSGRGSGVRVKESRSRSEEILFIDTRNMGYLINRRNRDLSDEDIALIAGTYHNWRASASSASGEYNDVQGFCKSATLDEVKALTYVLTPGRYIGLPDDEEDFNFPERFNLLRLELEKQMAEEAVLNKAIVENLAKIKVKG